MLVFPNAKINIGLHITEKRQDGFHNLETVFYPIDLTDILEFTVSKKNTSFKNTGFIIDIPKNQNLVLKAYHLLKENYKLPELQIHLHKIIPFGAGLGGGSSDAAYMLTALNSFFKLQLTIKELENFAQELGSDCPFFIQNKPVFAEKTGNIFSEIKLDLKDYFFLIVKPVVQIDTKEAFSRIIPKKSNISIKELVNFPVHRWKEKIKNDFEDGIFKLYPEIKTIKDKLYNEGAIYAQMSGSGSSVIGIFKEKPTIPHSFDSYFTFLQKPI